MSPREILAQAYVRRVVPAHLYGKTQEKTLQARLSEDISRLREKSLFFRTNRARFFLREFLNESEIPDLYKTEFLARPRRKDLRNERILIFNRIRTASDSKIISKTSLDIIFEKQNYRYLTWPELQDIPDGVPVYSSVIFHTNKEILTHLVGQFNEDSHPSKGFRSIGFGSVVRAQDSDLLYDAYHGIIGSAINELVYSLGLSSELARDARYNQRVDIHCAIAGSDPHIGSHLRVIMSYRCPDDFLVSKASLSLNRLAWLKPALAMSVSDFDDASQILLRSRRLSKLLRSA